MLFLGFREGGVFVVDAEVAVLGGGAAGLSAALTLARARRSVVVVDAGEPRNASAVAAHGLLGHEGIAPRQLLEKGRAEVSAFGAEIRYAAVTSVERRDSGFRVLLDDGERIEARALVVATGVHDQLPPIDGLAERWGRDVVHCPYCHGWEIRDQRIGLIPTTAMSALQTLMFHQWSDEVQFFTQGRRFSDSDLGKLAALGIPVIDQHVTKALVENDQLTGVLIEGGDRIDLDVLAVPTRTTARLNGLEGLGLETTDTGMGIAVVVDAAGHTSVPGVWAAGNVTNGAQKISATGAPFYAIDGRWGLAGAPSSDTYLELLETAAST